MNVRIRTLCTSAFAVLAFPLTAICQEGSAGIVEEIRGPVVLRQNTRAKSIRLDPRADAARRLYPGQQVRCETGGILSVRLGGKVKNIGTAWFTIPQATRSKA